MKRLLISVLFILVAHIVLLAQARIPVIMVRPGKQWCMNNQCFKMVDNQGTSKKVIDYEKALENMDMLASITEIEGLLSDEGLEVRNLSGSLDALEDDMMEDDLTDDEFGNGLNKGELDEARDKVTADFYLDLNWTVNKIGPKKQIDYSLVGTDFYTGKPAANVRGMGEPSFAASESQLLREAVVMKIPELKSRFQGYLDEMLTIGRAVTVKIKVSTASNINLGTPMEGSNLGRVINKWLTQNAKQHRVLPGRSSRTSAIYQVRIPLYDMDELPMSAEDFLWKLSEYLGQTPINVRCSIQNRGLGKAVLIIDGQ